MMSKAVSEVAGMAHVALDEVERLRAALTEIRGHLGAALVQSIATDDKIIMDHVRSAYVLAGGKL